MRPGVTMRPDTSRTWAPSSSRRWPTAATFPPAKATSVTRSRFCEGSMTRPLRRMRSKAMDLSLRCLGVDAQTALAVEQVHRLNRRGERDRGAGKEPIRVGAGRLDHLASDIDVEIVERTGGLDKRELARQREGVRPAIHRGEIVRPHPDEAPGAVSSRRHIAWKQIHLWRANKAGDEDIHGGAVD